MWWLDELLIVCKWLLIGFLNKHKNILVVNGSLMAVLILVNLQVVIPSWVSFEVDPFLLVSLTKKNSSLHIKIRKKLFEVRKKSNHTTYWTFISKYKFTLSRKMGHLQVLAISFWRNIVLRSPNGLVRRRKYGMVIIVRTPSSRQIESKVINILPFLETVEYLPSNLWS